MERACFKSVSSIGFKGLRYFANTVIRKDFFMNIQLSAAAAGALLLPGILTGPDTRSLYMEEKVLRICSNLWQQGAMAC